MWKPRPMWNCRAGRRYRGGDRLLLRSRIYPKPIVAGAGLRRVYDQSVQLIPLSPLDGGRITAIISPKVWWVGADPDRSVHHETIAPCCCLIAIMRSRMLSTFRGGPHGLPERYYDVPLSTRVNHGLYHLGPLHFWYHDV